MNIAEGITKVVNDVATAWEATWPVLAELSFEFALHTAVSALLS